MSRTLLLAIVGATATLAFFIQPESTGAVEASKPKTSRAYLHSHNVPASGVAIDGYCPVAYFAVNKPVLGKPEFAATHNGLTYHFVSAGAREAFQKTPTKFLPAYGGWCAFGMAVQDKFPVDPKNFKIVDGKLHLFLRNEKVDALELWNGKPEGGLRKSAAAHWKKVRG